MTQMTPKRDEKLRRQTRAAILKRVESHPGATPAGIALAIGATSRAIAGDLFYLKSKNALVSRGGRYYPAGATLCALSALYEKPVPPELLTIRSRTVYGSETRVPPKELRVRPPGIASSLGLDFVKYGGA